MNGSLFDLFRNFGEYFNFKLNIFYFYFGILDDRYYEVMKLVE